MKTGRYLCKHIVEFFYVLDKSGRENQNIHFVFCNCYYENRAVCEIMCKHTAEPWSLHTAMQYGACAWGAG
jgi:hypothetical protein